MNTYSRFFTNDINKKLHTILTDRRNLNAIKSLSIPDKTHLLINLAEYVQTLTNYQPHDLKLILDILHKDFEAILGNTSQQAAYKIRSLLQDYSDYPLTPDKKFNDQFQSIKSASELVWYTNNLSLYRHQNFKKMKRLINRKMYLMIDHFDRSIIQISQNTFLDRDIIKSIIHSDLKFLINDQRLFSR